MFYISLVFPHYYVHNSFGVIWFYFIFLFYLFIYSPFCIKILCVGIYGFREKSHFNRYRQGNEIYVSFPRRMHMLNLIVNLNCMNIVIYLSIWNAFIFNYKRVCLWFDLPLLTEDLCLVCWFERADLSPSVCE